MLSSLLLGHFTLARRMDVPASFVSNLYLE